jgi:hypothetical protein
MKKDTRRKSRSYKVQDSAYKKAMKVAKKNKTYLSAVIEKFVTHYGNGDFILCSDSNGELYDLKS